MPDQTTRGSGSQPDSGAGGAKRPDLTTVDGIRTVSEETAQKLIRTLENSQPIRRLRSSQILTGVVGAAGLALFLVGVERAAEDIPIVENAYGSIAVGLLLLAITGLLIRKLVD